MFYCVQKQVKTHVDFVNTNLDMISLTHDITGLAKLSTSELEQVLSLEEEIKKAAALTATPVQPPGWFNYPMTPVASSFIKGAGSYKGKLLLEFHHDPGQIWGYDVEGQGDQFWRDILNSGSKGGWVWDKLLGKPSEYGMAKGKFFAYPDPNGGMKFHTTPGAEFVHHFGRPTKFTYNPVGFLTNEEDYNVKSELGKEWKEQLVEPFWSRAPISPEKLKAMQRFQTLQELQSEIMRRGAFEELGPMFEKAHRETTFQELQEELRRRIVSEEAGRMITRKTSGDFMDILTYLLDSQMTLTPIMSSVIDLVEDYKVKGHYADRGKPPKRTWIRRHKRGEGVTIKDKPRLTALKVREAHAKSIREKRREDVPIWSKIKDLRERHHYLLEKSKEMVVKGQTGIELSPFVREMEEINIKLDVLKVPKRKQYEDQIESYEDSIRWHEEQLTRLEKELENAFPDEIESILDSMREERAMIRSGKRYIFQSREKLEIIERFESQLFDTHNDLSLQYRFDTPLNEKLRVAKGLIHEHPLMFGMKIEMINEVFNKLPQNLQDSCKQIRIFEIANDDPAFGSLEGCGGFYDPPEETITIGLRTDREKNWLYSFGFIRESTVHEAAHALDFVKLNYNEKMDLMSFFDQNYYRLKNRGEYAAKNKAEFFAEGYAKLYTEQHNWFRGLTKGTKGFFQNIMKKYDFIIDFIMTALNEKINGIKFSYQLNDKLIFGFYRIPEEISQEDAEIMVSEGKAQFENVDKYIDFGEGND